MTGLDYSSGKSGMPRCPFPVCNGTAWASLEALLMHYASHHHVLEKLMMYESELQCIKYRSIIDDNEDEINHLKKKVSKLEGQLQEEKDTNSKLAAAASAVSQAATTTAAVKGEKESCDAETNTGPGVVIKDESKQEMKKMMKSVKLTDIENQTLKKEYLQIKKEKEKTEKLLEQKIDDFDQLTKAIKIKQQEHESDLKSAVENAKKWKETCLGEEEHHGKELATLKSQMASDKKEIENLKNIIEIGKSTVENAKQVSSDLMKEKQATEDTLEAQSKQLKKCEDNLKVVQTRYEEGLQEMTTLRDLVQHYSDKLEDSAKDHHKDMEKYKNLLEVMKRKDVDIQTLRATVDTCNAESTAMSTALAENMRSWQAEKLAMQQGFRKEVERNSQMLREQQEIIKQKQEEINGIKVKLEDAKKEAAHLSRQITQLKEKIQDLEDAAKETETTHNQIQSDLEAELKEKEEVVENLKGKSEDVKKENEELKETESRLKVELEIGKVARNDLEGRILDLTNRFNTKARGEEELRKKLGQMSAELKVQGWEIDNYKNKLINSEMFISSLAGSDSQPGGSKLVLPCNSQSLLASGSSGTDHFSQFAGGSQDFIIPSVYSMASEDATARKSLPDLSLTSQQEYNEADNSQIDLPLSYEVKKEVQETSCNPEPSIEVPTQETTRELNVKQDRSSDSMKRDRSSDSIKSKSSLASSSKRSKK
eukprot:TRINITY_DN2212_c0_g1_i4.p1 TRINITY_DN2212_c0_g1~~TRINITY_DN2212_c0_g1_i4.p1  ORF type:complete len:709 (-),score=264.57 TRINITY_DN2212_c0_g1_i4:539-2665(-)